MRRPTRLLATAAVLALTFWSAHAIAPEHPHELAAYAKAAQYAVSLAGGEVAEVHSANCYQVVTVHDRNWTDVTCGSSWTPTPIPPTVTPAPKAGQPCPAQLHDASRWHPPVDPSSGCFFGHEHGDAPPSWAPVGFDHAGGFHGNTSAIENVAKHAAMKGFLLELSNATVYFRVHMASNPGDRASRFHSYEVYAKDPSGAISHWQGWFDAADPTVKANRPTQLEVQTPGAPHFPNPVVIGIDRASWDAGKGTEQWYATTAGWSWAFGWGIDNPTTFFKFGEALDYDPTHWDVNPGRPQFGPALGTTRRLEASFYRRLPSPPQTGLNRGGAPEGVEFWATPRGELVSGPSDARCAEPTICLPQMIRSSMPQVAFDIPGGNARQKSFAAPGLEVPN